AIRYVGGRALVDDLVGKREQRSWYREPKSAGSLDIDDQLELARLQDRQVGGLFAVQNAARIISDLAYRVRKTRAIAYQAPRYGEITILEDRRNRVTCCQRGKLRTPGDDDEERIGTD